MGQLRDKKTKKWVHLSMILPVIFMSVSQIPKASNDICHFPFNFHPWLVSLLPQLEEPYLLNQLVPHAQCQVIGYRYLV